MQVGRVSQQTGAGNSVTHHASQDVDDVRRLLRRLWPEESLPGRGPYLGGGGELAAEENDESP